jgi:hypothetical protein
MPQSSGTLAHVSHLLARSARTATSSVACPTDARVTAGADRNRDRKACARKNRRIYTCIERLVWSNDVH